MKDSATVIDILKSKGYLENYGKSVDVFEELQERQPEAIQYAKAGDIEKAEESIQTAKETVNEAHHAQTELIQAEIRGEKAPLNLLMVHAQDHLMCALVVIDLAQEFIDVYKKLA